MKYRLNKEIKIGVIKIEPEVIDESDYDSLPKELQNLYVRLEPISKEQLIDRLRSLASEGNDPESDHGIADNLLLEYIDDPEVTKLFSSINKWYA